MLYHCQYCYFLLLTTTYGILTLGILYKQPKRLYLTIKVLYACELTYRDYWRQGNSSSTVATGGLSFSIQCRRLEQVAFNMDLTCSLLGLVFFISSFSFSVVLSQLPSPFVLTSTSCWASRLSVFLFFGVLHREGMFSESSSSSLTCFHSMSHYLRVD